MVMVQRILEKMAAETADPSGRHKINLWFQSCYFLIERAKWLTKHFEKINVQNKLQTYPRCEIAHPPNTDPQIDTP